LADSSFLPRLVKAPNHRLSSSSPFLGERSGERRKVLTKSLWNWMTQDSRPSWLAIGPRDLLASRTPSPSSDIQKRNVYYILDCFFFFFFFFYSIFYSFPPGMEENRPVSVGSILNGLSW
jgi:hypothetical protein